MCFSLLSLVYLLVWVVVICGVIAIVRLVLAQFVPAPPYMGVILQALWIVIWVVVVIGLIWLFYDLLTCFIPLGGPRLR